MRKYFLLSAVALLVTTSANATTDYAEVTAKATIEVANEFSCDEINYGTIVVKQGNESFTIGDLSTGGDVSHIDDIISWKGTANTSAYCTGMNTEDMERFTTELTNAAGDTISLIIESGGGSRLSSDITIPADVQPGEYTGSFTLTVVR